MTRHIRIASASLVTAGLLATLLMIFMAWRNGGLALLQLGMSIC